jgi:hypothetical protein
MKRPSESLLEFAGNELDTRQGNGCRTSGESENSALTDGLAQTFGTGVIVGVLVGFQEANLPLVDFTENTANEAILARSTVTLSTCQIGTEVALAFDRGDPSKPIILGCLLTRPQSEREETSEAEEDQLVFSAQREIVLICGKASITLTRAGKILIRGAYLLNQSSGVIRIKGGSVQIN